MDSYAAHSYIILLEMLFKNHYPKKIHMKSFPK